MASRPKGVSQQGDATDVNHPVNDIAHNALSFRTSNARSQILSFDEEFYRASREYGERSNVGGERSLPSQHLDEENRIQHLGGAIIAYESGIGRQEYSGPVSRERGSRGTGITSLAEEHRLGASKISQTSSQKPDPVIRRGYSSDTHSQGEPKSLDAYEVFLGSAIKAIDNCWPVLDSPLALCKLNYQLHWEVPKFLRSRFAPGQSLGDIMTTTGDSLNAQATTCRDYLYRQWPAGGYLVLEAMEKALSSPVTITCISESSSVKLGFTNIRNDPETVSIAAVTVETVWSLHCEIALALSWLCAAIRSSVAEGISMSRCSIVANASIIEIKLEPLSSLPKYGSNCCWHSLFENAVIASDFRPCPREEGAGLEISFLDMANLAKSYALVEVDGGLVLDGLATLLYPVAVLSSNEAMQWHMEVKDSKSGKILQPESYVADRGLRAWHKELNSNKLVTARIFLGWTEEAVVVIGTNFPMAAKVEVSGAFDSDRFRTVMTYGGSMGIGYKGFATLTGTVSASRAAVPSGISGIENKEIKALRNVLKTGVEDQTIIYDDDAQTGWVTAYSSLYVFLTQIFVLNKEQPWINLPAYAFAEARPDGGQAALETMIHWLEAGPNLPQNGTNYEDLSQYLAPICYHVSRVEHQLQKIYAQALNVAPGKILGVELIDVALLRSSMPVKKAKVKTPWAYLPQHQPCFVLFCKNLGQAIVPTSSRGLCQEWTTVPANQNLLVATGPSLLYLLLKRTRRSASRLGDHITWKVTAPLIKLHRSRRETDCSHIQWLKSKVPSEEPNELLSAVERCKDGGYVFHNVDRWKFPNSRRPVL